MPAVLDLPFFQINLRLKTEKHGTYQLVHSKIQEVFFGLFSVKHRSLGMDFRHLKMSAVYEDAEKLVTDPLACFRVMTASMHLTLPPRSLGNAKEGILEQLDAQVRLYNERYDINLLKISL